MIELERHIEILLLSNDCVIVPDLGGFMAYHVDASYDEEESLFLPPRRTLGFNPQLTLNDSLLAQSYIEAYDISYPEAIRRIADEVRELKQRLETDGEYVLNDIGKLSINSNGKYEFEPCESGILSPELYGLSSFEMKRLPHGNETITLATTPIKVEDDGTKTQDTSSDAKEKVEQTERKSMSSNIFLDDDDDKSIHIKVSLIRNIAVACAVILLFLIIPSPISNGDLVEVSSSAIDTGLLQRIMPKDITKGTPTSSTLKPSLDSVKSKQVVKKDTVTPAPTSFYSVVLCSKVTLRNAKNYTITLHKHGYEEAEVLKRGRLAKVIYGRYATQSEAQHVVNKLNNHEEFKDCWVMKVKNS